MKLSKANKRLKLEQRWGLELRCNQINITSISTRDLVEIDEMNEDYRLRDDWANLESSLSQRLARASEDRYIVAAECPVFWVNGDNYLHFNY